MICSVTLKIFKIVGRKSFTNFNFQNFSHFVWDHCVRVYSRPYWSTGIVLDVAGNRMNKLFFKLLLSDVILWSNLFLKSNQIWWLHWCERGPSYSKNKYLFPVWSVSGSQSASHPVESCTKIPGSLSACALKSK